VNKKRKFPQVPEASLKGVVRTNLDSPQPTAAQLDRKRRSTAAVKEMGLPTLESLPVVEEETIVRPRSGEDVARRCLAVAFCAVKGETGEQPMIDALVKEFGASSYFSPKEARFIRNLKPERQDLIDFTWRYECDHVLLWALGLVESLKPPNEICDVATETRTIRKKGPKTFVSKARLRPMAEILDAADLYYRLHWAAIELRLRGKSSDAVDEGIVRERHRALNWLIRYMDQEWDDVTTDT
jgi:hypothetical protein